MFDFVRDWLQRSGYGSAIQGRVSRKINVMNISLNGLLKSMILWQEQVLD